MTSSILLASSIDVVLWAIGRRNPITTADIRERWGVSKCTAWRWLGPLNDARERALLMDLSRRPATRQPCRDQLRVEVRAQ